MRTNKAKKIGGLLLMVAIVLLLAMEGQAIPPDPDNAALLYYQAFLSLPELDDAARDRISEVARGNADPNDAVRETLQECQGAIGFAEAAANVPTCHWGFRYSQGFDALMPQLAQARLLTFVLVADARVRAADGDYKGALDRCLMVKTFARQIGDDTLVSYLVAIAIRAMADRCMIDVVGSTSGDVQLLRWLKGEVTTSPPWSLTPVRPLRIEMEIALDAMQIENFETFLHIAAGEDESVRAKIRALATEGTLAQGREMYAERVTTALDVLSASMPYGQAYAKLETLDDGLDPNDPASVAAGMLLPAISRVYTLKTRSTALDNALKAGIDICLRKAETGKLPAAFPAGLPKDPFSGQDFAYEQTDNGFVLRCQGQELGSGGKVDEFTFTVK